MRKWFYVWSQNTTSYCPNSTLCTDEVFFTLRCPSAHPWLRKIQIIMIDEYEMLLSRPWSWCNAVGLFSRAKQRKRNLSSVLRIHINISHLVHIVCVISRVLFMMLCILYSSGYQIVFAKWPQKYYKKTMSATLQPLSYSLINYL